VTRDERLPLGFGQRDRNNAVAFGTHPCEGTQPQRTQKIE
jgi:hypothetical protein